MWVWGTLFGFLVLLVFTIRLWFPIMRPMFDGFSPGPSSRLSVLLTHAIAKDPRLQVIRTFSVHPGRDMTVGTAQVHCWIPLHGTAATGPAFFAHENGRGEYRVYPGWGGAGRITVPAMLATMRHGLSVCLLRS
jgi:hypothetical protein